MKNDYLVSAVMLALAMTTLSAFVGCGQSGYSQGAMNPVSANGGNSAISIDPALVGRWVEEENKGLFITTLDLLKDGTGVWNYWRPVAQTDSPNGVGGIWRAENDCLYFFSHTVPNALNTNVYEYKISEATLTLTCGRDGRSVTLKKRQK